MTKLDQSQSERLSAIRQRLEAATPGPWESRCKSILDNSVKPKMIWAEFGFVAECLLPAAYSVPDAEFIARCPEDVAYLLKRVGKLEEALRQIRANDLAKVYGGFGLGLKPVSKIASEALEEEE